jgi:hypothetical protein
VYKTRCGFYIRGGNWDCSFYIFIGAASRSSLKAANSEEDNGKQPGPDLEQ